MEITRTRVLRILGLAVMAGSLGCDDISVRSNNTGSSSLQADRERCDGEPEVTELEWDEDSELGSPAQAFSGIEGECDGALRWSSEAEAPTKKPASMHVDVQLDHASARLVQHTDRNQQRSGCVAELEVDARVGLQSDDAAVAAHESTRIRYVPNAPTTFGFTLTRDEHRGALMLQDRKGATTMLSFELDGARANCAGEIMVATTSTSSDGTTHGSAGRIGTWSKSGCAVGQTPFDIEQAIGDSTLPALIEDAWNGRELDGTWEDGAQTKLSLHVMPLTAATCSEQRDSTRVVTQPVNVRYSTEDGRLAERETTANVRAQLSTENTLRELSIWISDEMTCSSTTSQLAYAPVDCTQTKAATVQLGLSSSGASDGGLNVYFIPRFADQPPPRDTLTLH